MPVCTEPLEALVPQVWPELKRKPAEVLGSDEVGAAEFCLETLRALAAAQEAASDWRGAARTRVRGMLAAMIEANGDWNAYGPMQEAEAFWRLARQLPASEPLPPTLWLNVLDRDHSEFDFLAPEDEPHGMPFGDPGVSLVVRPGQKVATLTVSADMETPGGFGYVRCFTMSTGKPNDLGEVQWYRDSRPGHEWRTATFDVPADIGIIRLEITPAAGNDFHVHEMKVKAVFAAEAKP